MSDFLMRNLAMKAASHPKIESAVMGAIRDTLPGVIEGLLRDGFAGETIRLYVPKTGRDDKKVRDGLIRARFNGTNAVELAGQFGISAKQILRIARCG